MKFLSIPKVTVLMLGLSGLLACQNQVAETQQQKQLTQEPGASAIASTTKQNYVIAGSWKLTAVQSDQGQSKWDLPQDSAFTLTITASDDTASATATGIVACNRWKSSVVKNQQKIQISPAMTTRARCHSADQQVAPFRARYLQQLQLGMAIAKLTEQQLILLDDKKQQWLFDVDTAEGAKDQ